MTVNLFYNKVTEEIANYSQFKSHFTGLSFPTDQMSTVVDDVIADTAPPNPFLSSFPTLADWERLYRDDVPTIRLWEISELDAPAFNSGNSHWEQHYTTRNRTEEEMGEVNQNVFYSIEGLKQDKLGGYVISGDLVSDATQESQNAVTRLISNIQNIGEQTIINWQGNLDDYGLPQWTDATVEDLQDLSIAMTEYEQKAYTAARLTFEEQLNTPFDDYSAIETFFNNTYDGL